MSYEVFEGLESDLLRHRITPSLTQSSGFESLQAAPSSTTRQAVGDSMSKFVDEYVIFHRAVAGWLFIPCGRSVQAVKGMHSHL